MKRIILIFLVLSALPVFSAESESQSIKKNILKQINNIDTSKLQKEIFHFENEAGGEILLTVYRSQNKIRKVNYSCYEGGAVAFGGKTLEYFDSSGNLIYMCCSVDEPFINASIYFHNGKIIDQTFAIQQYGSVKGYSAEGTIPFTPFNSKQRRAFKNAPYYFTYHLNTKSVELHRQYLQRPALCKSNVPGIPSFCRNNRTSVQLRAPKKGSSTFIKNCGVLMRNKPEQGGEIITRLTSLQNITVLEVSDRADEIGSWGKHHWYKVKPIYGNSKTEGWVFGAFLDAVE
jgi:hypothetical protein